MLARIALSVDSTAVWHDDGSLEIVGVPVDQGGDRNLRGAVHLAPVEVERLTVLLGSPAYSVEQALSTLAPVVGPATVERLRAIVDDATAAAQRLDALIDPPAPAALVEVEPVDVARELVRLDDLIARLTAQRRTLAASAEHNADEAQPADAAGLVRVYDDERGVFYTLTRDDLAEYFRARRGTLVERPATPPADEVQP